ncbi:class I SAM-dependent methyltransferase [Phenylobacterium sp.]|uniref:class I SAM-dependent methyltransferase n=1 Tax=Phenylobacterium sp. TaxID=1871053 RepID=UPI0035B2C12E
MHEQSRLKPRHPHSHMWLMGLVGLAAGLALMVYAPTLKGVSTSLLLFAGFHVVGGLVLLTTLWVTALRGPVRRWTHAAERQAKGYDFGWGPGWMNGLGVAALAALAAAVAVEVSAPALWPLAFLLVAAGVVFVVGNLVMRGFRRLDHVVLPMVDLLRSDRDVVLDAGCGSGRTTIALSRVLKDGHVIAVDRFDAGYIDEGGRRLLERNLALAGLTDKVSIETADLTALPFAAADFDAAVSTHVYDHLGRDKQAGLAEMFRVLKPGARFLMGVRTPGWSMFAVGSVLSFLLTSKVAWRRMAAGAGFAVIDEGAFNGTWFVLLEKPDAT